MSILPRLAVGTIQPEADPQAIVWALLDALEQDGVRTQTFLSRACFIPHDGAAAITGSVPRHLDSWLMSSEVCRHAFLRKAATADLAIVEGRYDQAVRNPQGGSLDTLCDWLDLPRIAIVDVARLNHCQLPERPAADAVLLDRVGCGCDFYHWQTMLQSLWNIPVFGGLGECAAIRQNIAMLPIGNKPPREWCSALGEQLRRHSGLDRLRQLASRRGVPSNWPTPEADGTLAVPRGRVNVAVAYDDAFHCYFPDTLDMLELCGATVRVFSPLRDECLPADTDIVYLGCGSPQEHAESLAQNHCMLMALKEHVCSGRRIYAEGGGLAYLCQHIELAHGSRVPMVGALRAIARRNPVRVAPAPIEVTLAVDSWLGTAGTKLRGYRNGNWHLEPTGCLTRFATEADCELDLIGRHQAIGSRIHLNFAAQPSLLGGFLRPCPEALAWAAK
jgi:cobyrinic acid a,c-diamide synthase